MFNISAKIDFDLDDPNPTWKNHKGSAKFDYYEFHNKVMNFKAQNILESMYQNPSDNRRENSGYWLDLDRHCCSLAHKSSWLFAIHDCC